MLSKYNIDALRNKDGSYRPASAALIKGALGCGHTAHLQTGRGTVAFRPYHIEEVRINARTGEPYFPGEKVGRNWLVEFFPTGHEHGDEIRLYTSDPKAALAFAFQHLNGKPHVYVAGDFVEVWSNQAMRDGSVLAVRGFEVLVEYEMPAGTSALVVYHAVGTELSHVRNYSYNSVPKCWLDAMHDQGTNGWIGMGQRCSTAVQFPTRRDK